jgi:hypothetical protein
VNRALLAVGLVCASASSALAADLDYTPPAAPAPPDMVGLVFRLVGLTLGLLALCGVVLYFARRATQPKGLKGDGGGRLVLESSLVLDRRSSLHIIRVDGQTVAVTTDATGLGSMVLLSDPFDAALEDAEARAAGGSGARA